MTLETRDRDSAISAQSHSADLSDHLEPFVVASHGLRLQAVHGARPPVRRTNAFHMAGARRNLFAVAAAAVLAVLIAIAYFALPDGGSQLWSGLKLEIQTMQRDLHGQLAAAMRAVQAEGITAGLALVILSFLYGVFHAAAPGHGKVVISTYILTHESYLRRGIQLSLLSSLCQGMTAVLAVFGTVGLLSLPMREVNGAAVDLEMLSYGFVALVGAALVVGRARRLWRRRRQPSLSLRHIHADGRGCNSCGHAHVPSQRQLEAPLSWTGVAGIIASIGLRPCSGAILVLLVAVSMDLKLAGIAAVLAMSLGTAITVSLLATLAVYARKTTLRLAAHLPDSESLVSAAADIIGLAGGLLIALFGAVMFQALWSAPTHPLL